MSFVAPTAIIGSLPNTISNGQTADAIPVMADFNYIVSQVNANAAPLADTPSLTGNNSFSGNQTFTGSITSSSTITGTAVSAGGWTNYTPSVILAGAGTTPQYTTNTGRWSKINKTMDVRVYLSGDGGNEGGGAVQIGISLPSGSPVGASAPANLSQFIGSALNNATPYQLHAANLAPGSTTIQLTFWSAINALSSLSANDQNNATRNIIFGVRYEVD